MFICKRFRSRCFIICRVVWTSCSNLSDKSYEEIFQNIDSEGRCALEKLDVFTGQLAFGDGMVRSGQFYR